MQEGDIRISIDQCPHGFYSITIGDGRNATKLMPARCCGRWNTLKEWPMSESILREMINELECALEEVAKGGR